MRSLFDIREAAYVGGWLQCLAHLRHHLQDAIPTFDTGWAQGDMCMFSFHAEYRAATDAKLAQEMSNKLLDEGIYVIGFFFPVVPEEKARIRVQISAAHSKGDLDRAINAFIKVGKSLKIV